MIASSTGGWREAVAKAKQSSTTCYCGGKYHTEAGRKKHEGTKTHQSYKGPHKGSPSPGIPLM